VIVPADQYDVVPDTIRQTLSAQLDGEHDPRQRPPLDAHVITCAACRHWLDAAARINRPARTNPGRRHP
jgi:predicted anti-sigma-YlaC factor YlaD